MNRKLVYALMCCSAISSVPLECTLPCKEATTERSGGRRLLELYKRSYESIRGKQAFEYLQRIKAEGSNAVKLELAEFLKSEGEIATAHSLFHELADAREPKAMLEDAGYHLAGSDTKNIMRGLLLLKGAALRGNQKAAFFASVFHLILPSVNKDFTIPLWKVVQEIELLSIALGRDGISDSEKTLGRYVCCEYGSYVLACLREGKDPKFLLTKEEMGKMLESKKRYFWSSLRKKKAVLKMSERRLSFNLGQVLRP